MTRDNFDRMDMFGVNLTVERIALNMDQVEEYNPPPNPAKLTDSRCGGYMSKYGDKSWELDALDPHTINALILEAAAKHTNQGRRNKLIARQETEKELLKSASDRWDDIVYLLEDE